MRDQTINDRPSVQTESDSRLLERYQSGEREAFKWLYERYKGRLYAYCFRLLRNGPDAEDAVHETFLKLSIGLDSLRHAAAIRTWLYRVARNESLMMIRRARGSPDIDPDTLWDDVNPLHILAEKDTVRLVQHALSEMKVEYRDVLMLREYDGMSYAEIAEITGSTLDAVKSRIFKARKALMEKLRSQFNEGNDL